MLECLHDRNPLDVSSLQPTLPCELQGLMHKSTAMVSYSAHAGCMQASCSKWELKIIPSFTLLQMYLSLRESPMQYRYVFEDYLHCLVVLSSIFPPPPIPVHTSFVYMFGSYRSMQGEWLISLCRVEMVPW